MANVRRLSICSCNWAMGFRQFAQKPNIIPNNRQFSVAGDQEKPVFDKKPLKYRFNLFELS
jgi:hypothetical protein